MTTVPIPEAEDRLPELLAEVERGGDVILTRDGQPVARLVPYDAPQPPAVDRKSSAVEGRIGANDAAPPEQATDPE